jgi:hypothetical protein
MGRGIPLGVLLKYIVQLRSCGWGCFSNKSKYYARIAGVASQIHRTITLVRQGCFSS